MSSGHEYLPSPEEIQAERNGHVPLELIEAASFMAKPLPEPDQIVHGILHQGSKFCIGGASKACKTWALLDLALAVANGQPWLSFNTTKGRVLYLNFEIQNFAWQKRIKIVCDSRNLHDLSNITLLNLRGQATNFLTLIPRIIDAAKNAGFCLIIIDPIYKLYGHADENSARDVASLLSSIESLTHECNAAVAYASHFSKGNQSQKEALDRVSGSGVFARDPDSLLILTKHAEDNAFTVESTLRNFAPIEPFVVKWQFPLLIPDGSLDPQDLKKPGGRPNIYSETDVLNLLNEQSLSTTDYLKTSSSELGVSRASFFRIISTLEKSGNILKSKINGQWCRVNSTPNLPNSVS